MAILVDKFVENNVHIPATSICTSSAPEKFLIQITKMSDYCVNIKKIIQRWREAYKSSGLNCISVSFKYSASHSSVASRSGTFSNVYSM